MYGNYGALGIRAGTPMSGQRDTVLCGNMDLLAVDLPQLLSGLFHCLQKGAAVGISGHLFLSARHARGDLAVQCEGDQSCRSSINRETGSCDNSCSCSDSGQDSFCIFLYENHRLICSV